jgi:hypothetical protein
MHRISQKYSTSYLEPIELPRSSRHQRRLVTRALTTLLNDVARNSSSGTVGSSSRSWRGARWAGTGTLPASLDCRLSRSGTVALFGTTRATMEYESATPQLEFVKSWFAVTQFAPVCSLASGSSNAARNRLEQFDEVVSQSVAHIVALLVPALFLPRLLAPC